MFFVRLGHNIARGKGDDLTLGRYLQKEAIARHSIVFKKDSHEPQAFEHIHLLQLVNNRRSKPRVWP